MSIQLDQRNKITRAAGIVSGASINIYAVSFSREIAVSMRFGTAAEMDAYLVAQTIPMFLALSLSSLIQPVVIPLFANYKNSDPEEANRFINKTFGGGILISLLSIQTAILPFFAEQAGKNNFQQLKKDFYQTANLIFFALFPICVLMVFFNQNIVRLFFQRGAFDERATIAKGAALIGNTLGLIPHTIGLVGVRLAQATFTNKLIGFQGALNPFLKVGLNLLFIPLRGHIGIAVATSGMYLVGSIIILVGISIKLHVEFKWRFLVPLGKMAVSLSGLMIFLWITRFLMNGNTQNWWLDLEYTAGISVLSLLIYLGLCYLLKLEEARFLPLLIKRSFNRLESAWSRK
jgi:peptidoglycan biosynthesis protein MviN/MurJ (putative lipid II flippase)